MTIELSAGSISGGSDRLCDAKRADIGNTNHGYVTAIFDDLGLADAVTLALRILGHEALEPFLASAAR